MFVPFSNGKPSGKIEEVLTGFVSEDSDAQGRPAGVTVELFGRLLIADDVGNIIRRVSPVR